MHRLILPGLLILSLVLITACGRPDPRETYRDPVRGLYSNAVFERSRLAGRWHQVAGFAAANAPDCRPGGVEFTPQGDAMALAARLCLSGRDVSYSGKVSFVETGRMQLSGADPAGIGQPWWVIWVDVDYRTLVIGTPSGDFGFILNRDGALPQDRLAAAREILEWNGYDLSKLRLMRGTP